MSIRLAGLAAAVLAPSAALLAAPQDPTSSGDPFVLPTIDPGLHASLQGRDHLRLEGLDLAPGLTVTLDLVRTEVFAEDATIVVAGSDRNGAPTERDLARPDLELFRGVVEAAPESLAFLAVTPTATNGIVIIDGAMHVISAGPHGAALPVVSYALEDAVDAIGFAPFTCGTEELPGYAQMVDELTALESFGQGGLAGGDDGTCRVAEVAIETDHEFLSTLFGGDTVAAAAYAATLVGACSEIYVADLGTRFEITFLRLWETPLDPWTQGGTQGQLFQYRDYWLAEMDEIERDGGHFFSGRGLGGGVAWLGGMCDEEQGFALSANLNGFFPYPLENQNGQNWDVMVTAHEWGHNFGAPHTHSYDPPIDGCGLGDCTLAGQGTIMSYCHTCPGGLGNVNLFFAPANVDTMEAFLENDAACIDDDNGAVGATDFVNVLSGESATVDVIANDLGVNCDVVELASFDAVSAEGGVVALCVGCAADGSDALTYTPPADFEGGDSFSYQVQDSHGGQGTGLVSIQVLGLRAPDGPADALPGVEVAYYALDDPTQLPDFSGLESFSGEILDLVNLASTGGPFAGSGLADNVGAVFTGYVEVADAGVHTFFVESDDGSRLLIGDEVVVLNDGLHGMLEKSGAIALEPGRHSIRIEFFERGGGAGVIARVQGPSMPKQVIPAEMWFHGGGLTSPDLDGDGDVDGADLGVLLAQWGADGAADLDGSGTVDGADLGVLLAAWTG